MSTLGDPSHAIFHSIIQYINKIKPIFPNRSAQNLDHSHIKRILPANTCYTPKGQISAAELPHEDVKRTNLQNYEI